MSDARPRVFLVLDAVPFGVMEDLARRGHLASFGPVRPVVAPFPSLTTVAMPRLAHPLGAGPPPGYEPRWFHPPTGEIRGGIHDPESEAPTAAFRGRPSGVVDELALYTLPAHFTYAQIRWVRWSYGGGHWLGWITATDAVGHFLGRDALRVAVADVLAELAGLVDQHARETGVRPGVVLCSDHGMAFAPALRHLPADAVAAAVADLGPVTLVPHGDVGAGVAYCDPSIAEAVAERIAALPGVDHAVGRVGEREAVVCSRHGRARLTWFPWRTRTEPLDGDPLGAADLPGWIEDPALLAATWDRPWPFAAARIRDALTTLVQWPATALFSMADDHTYGPRATHVAARLVGGQYGTHGSLSRAQTLGFAATTEGDPWPPGPLLPEQVFAPWRAALAG